MWAVALLDEPSRRPDGFDLRRFWAERCREFRATRSVYRITVRAAPQVAPRLARLSVVTVDDGGARAPAGPLAPDGRVVLRVDLERRDIACAALLAYGAAVEVLEPAELRDDLARCARGVVALYESRPGCVADMAQPERA